MEAPGILTKIDNWEVQQDKEHKSDHSLVVIAALNGRVFFILRNDGKIEFRMSTNASPPKYIYMP
jgi:hypothetical protein